MNKEIKQIATFYERLTVLDREIVAIEKMIQSAVDGNDGFNMSISYLKEQIAEERKPNMTADEIVREELRIAMFDFSRHPFSYASQPNEEKKHKVVNFDSKLSDSSAILVLSILLEVRVNERKAIINECGKIMKYHE